MIIKLDAYSKQQIYNLKTINMDFFEQKMQILSLFQKGDRKKIAQRAGVTVYRLKDALEKNSINEMTEAQKKAYVEALKYISERIEENAKILQQKPLLSTEDTPEIGE